MKQAHHLSNYESTRLPGAKEKPMKVFVPPKPIIISEPMRPREKIIEVIKNIFVDREKIVEVPGKPIIQEKIVEVIKEVPVEKIVHVHHEKTTPIYISKIERFTDPDLVGCAIVFGAGIGLLCGSFPSLYSFIYAGLAGFPVAYLAMRRRAEETVK